MRKISGLMNLVALNCAVVACSVFAQGNPEGGPASVDEQLATMTIRFEQHPDVSTLNQMVATLGNISKAGDAIKAEARQLAADAAVPRKAGNNGEARRLLSRAVSLLLARGWNEAQEFGLSLAMRPDLIIADLSKPFLLTLSQSYAAHYTSKAALSLRLSLAEAVPRIAYDVPHLVAVKGKAYSNLATFDIANRDLIDEPQRLSANFKNVTEGSYLLFADVYEGDTLVTHSATPVYLVKDIESRRDVIAAKSAKIKAFGANTPVMTTIRYPFELADHVNANDFGITSFDFAGQIKRSEQLMAALASGKDLLTRAKGDNKRNYWLAEASEIMPYRLYVPKTWSATKKLPMIIAIHGGGLDENNMLDRGDGIVGKLAEQHGYIIAAPLGYHAAGFPGTVGGAPAGAPQVGGVPQANGGVPQAGGGNNRARELGDIDIMTVMENVAAEYNVDRSRIYMMGNSAGAGRTWSLGAKYGEKFAGLGPCASGTSLKNTSFEKFKNMPVIACVGELDTDNRKEVAKYGISKVKELSAHAEYIEVKGGTHGSAIQLAMPQIFEFFNKHTRPQ